MKMAFRAALATTWMLAPMAALSQTVPPVPTVAGIHGYNIPAASLAAALQGTTSTTLAPGTVAATANAALPAATAAATLAGPGLTVNGSGQLQTNSPPVIVTTTTYTITAANCGQELHFTNTGTITTTLPSASATGTTAGCSFYIEGEAGAGTNTIAPTSGTINSSASITIAANTGSGITSDGANWRVFAATALVPGSGDGGITALTGDVSASGSGSQAATVNSYSGGTTFGTAAHVNLGTSGATIPELSTANTWSGVQTFSVVPIASNGYESSFAGNATNLTYSMGGTATGLFGSSSALDFATGNAARGCINSTSLLLALSSCAVDTIGGTAPQLQVQETGSTNPSNSAMVEAFQASGSVGGSLYLAHSYSGTLHTQTAVPTGALLGSIFGDGSDGTAFQNAGAMQVYADATPSTGIVPGRIALYSANAAGTLTEGMRLDSNSHVSFLPGYTAAVTGGTPDTYAGDKSGTVTASAASAVITFAKPYVIYVHCRVTSESGLAGMTYTPTLTTLTIAATGLSGTKVDYDCDGR